MTQYEQEVAQEFDSAMEAVVWLCGKYPRAKNDSRLLIQLYRYHIDKQKFIPPEEIEKQTPAETITRSFRKAKEKGLIILDDEGQFYKERRERAVSAWASQDLKEEGDF